MVFLKIRGPFSKLDLGEHCCVFHDQLFAVTIQHGHGGERITGLLDPAVPGVGLFGVHDGKRFAGLLPVGEVFMRLHKNRLSEKIKMKDRVGALLVA
ncbi:MAG: hypothetical protein ACAH07_08845, partial [Methylophilaceae bacterium]